MRAPNSFKELGLQTSYFWGETIHFFLAISKTIYFQQGVKQFIYFHIFLNPPPPPRYQMVRPSLLIKVLSELPQTFLHMLLAGALKNMTSEGITNNHYTCTCYQQTEPD